MIPPRPALAVLLLTLLASSAAQALGPGDLIRYRPSIDQALGKAVIGGESAAVPAGASFGPPHAATEGDATLLQPLAAGRAPRPALGTAELREPGQLVLYWPDAAAATAGNARLAAMNLAPSATVDLPSLGGSLALLQVTDDRRLADLRVRLRDALPEAVVDFNARYFPEGVPRQYFGGRILNPVAAGPAAPVALLDGPVAEVPALAATTVVRRSFLAAADRPADAVHATALATLVAGRDGATGFSGTAPGAPLLSAVIMRRQGETESTNSFILAQALDWALAQSARVINLSLGGPGDGLMAKLFARIAGGRAVIVAAAGNGGPAAAPSYPAAYPGVVAVTATAADDRIWPLANRGGYVAISAPGEDLWVPVGTGGRYVSGTSYAAGLVSGALARLLAAEPALDARRASARLCAHALDLGAPGPDPVFGCGLLRLAPVLGAGN
jgi:subtilisin family serine protease